MANHSSSSRKLSCSRNLFFANQNIISTLQFSRNPQVIQHLNYRFGEFFEIMKLCYIVIGNKTKVQVPKIMINRTTTTYSTYNMNIVAVNIILIDFLYRDLIFTNNDRRLVDIKQQIIVLITKVTYNIFFQS